MREAAAVRSSTQIRIGRVLALGVWLVAGCDPSGNDPAAPPALQTRPAETAHPADPTYVGSAECGRCHADALRSWSGSHHDLAMQPADATTVAGDFSAGDLVSGDQRFSFAQHGDRFTVHTAGADGVPATFDIAYTFGIDPLQQYLVRMPGGRLQALSVAWDTRPKAEGGQRWFHLDPELDHPPGDPFHWTGNYQTWNHMCAECHSTNLEKRFDPRTDSYQTRWAEIDVGCEACHGAGSAHVQQADAGIDPPGGLGVDFGSGDAAAQVDACAPCHSRRHRVSAEDRTGRPLFDDFMPATLRAGLYTADGQIEEEVYVYGSFVQSPMYAHGVACSDCHDPHSLELRAPGNALCVRCHSPDANPRFPTLAKRAYDTPEHHFHPVGSAGAQCVECHMPARTYMQIDPRRDHSLRVPRPDLSVELGTPNACTGCHVERDARWAAAAVTGWYGARPEAAHFARAFDAARRGSPSAVPALAEIVRDLRQPTIVRATALELSSAFGPSTADLAVEAMRDPHPWIRATAARTLAMLEPERQLALGAALLRDPMRAVRVEAGRALAAAEIESEPLRRARDAALREYTETQLAESDTPPALMNLGLLASGRGDGDAAIGFYRKALALDSDFYPARANLAVLFGALGRRNEAELLLREGIAREPDRGEFHYSLGLVLAEGERYEAAAGHIGRAAELMPERARVQYNLGLALERIGRDAEAGRALEQAARLAPGDPEIVYALALHLVERGQWSAAREPTRRLVELTRSAPQALELWRRVEAHPEAATVRE